MRFLLVCDSFWGVTVADGLVGQRVARVLGSGSSGVILGSCPVMGPAFAAADLPAAPSLMSHSRRMTL